MMAGSRARPVPDTTEQSAWKPVTRQTLLLLFRKEVSIRSYEKAPLSGERYCLRDETRCSREDLADRERRFEQTTYARQHESRDAVASEPPFQSSMHHGLPSQRHAQHEQGGRAVDQYAVLQSQWLEEWLTRVNRQLALLWAVRTDEAALPSGVPHEDLLKLSRRLSAHAISDIRAYSDEIEKVIRDRQEFFDAKVLKGAKRAAAPGSGTHMRQNTSHSKDRRSATRRKMAMQRRDHASGARSPGCEASQRHLQGQARNSKTPPAH
ncbi:hypothetical protein MRB53_038785 [Persea americana]|nr:hypothetical protein MRB53_038785 [Persea americana]